MIEILGYGALGYLGLMAIAMAHGAATRILQDAADRRAEAISPTIVAIVEMDGCLGRANRGPLVRVYDDGHRAVVARTDIDNDEHVPGTEAQNLIRALGTAHRTRHGSGPASIASYKGLAETPPASASARAATAEATRRKWSAVLEEARQGMRRLGRPAEAETDAMLARIGAIPPGAGGIPMESPPAAKDAGVDSPNDSWRPREPER